MTTPNLTALRPRIALRRWRRWTERTPFVGDALLAAHVGCAARTRILTHGKSDGERGEAIFAGKFAQFEAAYSGAPVEVTTRDERGG